MSDKSLNKLMAVAFFLVLTVSAWVITQYVAATLNYQKALFWCIYTGTDYKIYFPFAFFAWDYSFGHEAERLFSSSYGHFAMLTMIATLVLIFIRVSLKAKLTDNHGSARFASEEEIAKTDLLDGKGVFLGITEAGKYIRDNAYTHLFLCAPSRSGKGVGLIIPTLLYWAHSVIVTDVKGENWAFTAGWRKKMGHIVLKFDPTNVSYADNNGHFSYQGGGGSCRFNPFDEIRIGTPKEVGDTQNICRILVDPTGKGYEGSNAHWTNNAADLLIGIVLHLKYSRPTVNITTVIDFLAEDTDGLQAHLMKILEEVKSGASFHDNTGYILQASTLRDEKIYFHPYVQQIFTKMASTPDKEFGSIQSTLETALQIYRDPVIANNLSASDFTIADLMNNERPVSLYLIVPPSDIDRMMPAFRLIVELLYRRNVEKMEFDVGSKKTKENKHRLLMLLDEFPALGKMETFETAMGVIAGYGIKAFIICQSVQQINKIYGKDNGIISNCEVRVFFAPNDDVTPKFLSSLMGKKTVESHSKSTNSAVITMGAKSYSYNEMSRDLMTPDEISTMDRSKEIVLKTGVRPILGRKITWYNNPHFKDRPCDPPAASDRIPHVEVDWRKAALAKIGYEEEQPDKEQAENKEPDESITTGDLEEMPDPMEELDE